MFYQTTSTSRQACWRPSLVLMPATLFIGATFPLAVRIYAAGAEVAARASAQRIRLEHTSGPFSVQRSPDFSSCPLLKYEGAIRAMVLLSLGLAVDRGSALCRPRGACHFRCLYQRSCTGGGGHIHSIDPVGTLKASVAVLPDHRECLQ